MKTEKEINLIISNIEEITHNWTEVRIQSLHENKDEYVSTVITIDTCNGGKQSTLFFIADEVSDPIFDKDGKIIQLEDAIGFGDSIASSVHDLYINVIKLIKHNYNPVISEF